MSRIRPSLSLKQLVLMYVEDESSIREPFLTLVERYFKKVYVATNGEEGVEVYNKYKDEIDIIISDIKMPKRDGLSMAEEIKRINPEVHIIFSTAFGDSDYMQRAIDIGADGYIVKPIDRNKLFTKLNFLADAIIFKKKSQQYMHLIEILFNYQKNGLILFDSEWNVKMSNQAFLTMFGNEEFNNIDELLSKCYDENGNDLDKDLILSKKDIVCLKDGSYFNLKIDIVEDNFLLNVTDVTSYYMQTEKIKDIAMKDALTGLYNRKKLDIMSHSFIGSNICLIILDIDNFKQVNDTYGHLKGDEVLKLIAKVMKENVRASDLLVRWGGEEFVIILQLNDMNVTQSLAEKLRLKITQEEISEVGNVTCSFGLSCGMINSKNDVDKVLQKADEALYKAKRNGKNRVEVN